MHPQTITTLFAILITVLFLILILREVWCWYWKINKISGQLSTITDRIDVLIMSVNGESQKKNLTNQKNSPKILT